jgi:hypothetical protein
MTAPMTTPCQAFVWRLAISRPVSQSVDQPPMGVLVICFVARSLNVVVTVLGRRRPAPARPIRAMEWTSRQRESQARDQTTCSTSRRARSRSGSFVSFALLRWVVGMDALCPIEARAASWSGVLGFVGRLCPCAPAISRSFASFCPDGLGRMLSGPIEALLGAWSRAGRVEPPGSVAARGWQIRWQADRFLPLTILRPEWRATGNRTHPAGRLIAYQLPGGCRCDVCPCG